MKDAVEGENYICEMYPSKFHDEGFVVCLVDAVMLASFMYGCWCIIIAIQQWLQSNSSVPLTSVPLITPPLKRGLFFIWFAAVIAFFILRPIYLRSYREGEDDARRNDTVRHETVGGEQESLDPWLSLPFFPAKERCEAEYLLNALCQPPIVYIRMYESLRPSARTLAVETHLDIVHINDVRNEKLCDSLVNTAIVPVVFHKRGELINHLNVSDANGHRLQTMQTSLVAKTIVDTLGGLFMQESREDKELLSAWEKCQRGYYEELRDTTKAMKSSHMEVSRLLNQIPKSEANTQLIESLYTLVNTLASCYVLCVRISIGEQGSGTPHICMNQRLPLYLKPRDYIRTLNAFGKPRRGQWAINAINDCLNGIAKTSGMFYYNLANASLTQSYHLTMLGPEETFCARADILEVPPATKRYSDAGEPEELSPKREPPCDHNVRCEPLRGQRHAHILFGNALNYHNATFIFHYIGRPQDLYFAAGFLATVCLIGLLVGMFGVSDNTLNTDTPAIMLIALSAICPWLYDRERNDRSESTLLDLSAFLTTVASIMGLLLFVYSKLCNASHPDAIAFTDATAFSWRLLMTCIAADAAGLLTLSLLHASLYKARRLGRIDRRHGIMYFLGKFADSMDSVRDEDLKKKNKHLWRLRHLASLTSAETCGVILKDNEGDSSNQEGPFIASRDWPRGWLATPGTFWWGIERQRYSQDASPTTSQQLG